MPIITFPNKDKKKFDGPVTSFQVASEISASLASEAFISVVNGELWDLNRLIETDSTISILIAIYS